jgi:type IV pilus assembly protein PilC
MGEKSGNLFKVLKGLEDYYKVNIFFRNTVKNALAYPMLIVTSTISLLIFIVLFVIPSLYDFYISLDAEIPLICKLSYNLSNYIKENPVLVLVYIFDFVLVLPWFLCKYYFKNIITRLFNKIPLYREFNEFLFVSILGIIMKSGVNLSEGLICAANSFKIRDLRDRFMSLNNSILKGESISDSLINKGYYSNYTISIIKLGEEGGSIDERLESLTSYLEKKLIDGINKKAAIIQPASILIVGGFVITFLMIFIVPLFSSIFEVAI